MNQSGETKHDAELQKAFAEFKDSLRHGVDPANDAAPKVEAQIFDAPPATVRPAAPRITPAAGPEKGAARGSETKIPAAAEAGGRRKLLYLSAAVVISGLAALGWTLTRGHGTNDPEIEAAAPAAEENAEMAATPLDAQTGADPSRPTETATTDATTPATEVAPTQTDSAAAPQSEAPANMAAVPQPATAPTPPIENQSARTEPVAQPEAQKAAAPAVTAPAAAANATPAKQEAALAPATAPTEAEPAKPAAAKPKPARPKAAAKPKPATQARRNPTDAAPVAPPPAPVAAETPPPPPPPAPAPSEGPLGFVKNTVNSVGSTLTNLGRGATGN